MKTEKIITLFERYITNSQEEIDWYESMNIPLKLNYVYVPRDIPIGLITKIRAWKGSDKECVVHFVGGGNTVCLGNHDEMFIRLNDLRNNEIEDEGI